MYVYIKYNIYIVITYFRSLVRILSSPEFPAAQTTITSRSVANWTAVRMLADDQCHPRDMLII